MEPKVRRTSPGFAGWAKIFNLWFQWVAIALNLRKILRILEASWSHLHAPPGRVKVVPLDGRPFPSPSDKSGSPQMTGGTWEDILDVCITLHYTVYKRLGSWNVVKTKASKALLFREHFPTLTCWHHRFWRIGTRSVWINDWLQIDQDTWEFSLRWKTRENSCPAHLEAVWCPVNRVRDDYSVRDDFRKLCPCHSCCYEG